ncbi:ADP-dependent NAD(P)H-hydrate dehydratase [Glaciibacter sp. 2TAF33]|uniref:ADP-dependent NAD(P)H-hydrate dehydratase n=1 Tax=Glaciibacter sp. 2TAF33 TaxID=3233015 RepID=UPI003F917F59
MAKPREWLEWAAEEARDWIAVPTRADDKYSRGVLGVRTGSDEYPGAAVLGVEAAMRAGVGMVRYLGPARAADLVLARRPEVVTEPGRVQAWLLGSGMSAASRDPATTAAVDAALAERLPTVVDAGALDRVKRAGGAPEPGNTREPGGPLPLVITPHARELSSLLAGHGTTVTAAEVGAHPAEWAIRAAKLLGVTVLLKGSTTHVASPSAARLTVSGATGWLATAGTGDVLGGILGALVATHAELATTDADALAALAATAALIHGHAASRASAGGPITALGVAEAVPATIAALLAG